LIAKALKVEKLCSKVGEGRQVIGHGILAALALEQRSSIVKDGIISISGVNAKTNIIILRDGLNNDGVMRGCCPPLIQAQ
jgi:flagellar basal body rod protein FlgF